MKNHTFIKVRKGNWIVRCKKTGGDFNTILWTNGKVKPQHCICCDRPIIK